MKKKITLFIFVFGCLVSVFGFQKWIEFQVDGDSLNSSNPTSGPKTTTCGIASLPFWEGFNLNSSSLNCWIIIDNNKDALPTSSSNKWEVNTTSFEGDQSIRFYGGPSNDDWLISPTIKMDSTKVYKLKYHFKTTSSYDNIFEVLVSDKGSSVADFTNVLVSSRVYRSNDWAEETVFIKGFQGDVNIGWHVITQNTTYVYIDNVFIEEVDCSSPQYLNVKELKSDEVTLFWKDDFNKSWEFVAKPQDGIIPNTSGIKSTLNEVAITKDFAGNSLVSGVDYEYYVRSICESGGFTDWVGPFEFVIPCKAIPVPMIEDFNSTSLSINCWTIIDNNKDAVSSSNNNIWAQKTLSPYEGDRVMHIYSNSPMTDDWLISPLVYLDGKKYAISYYYKTRTSGNNEFEVLLSTDGVAISDFKTVLEHRKKRNVGVYEKKTLYVKDITGDVSIAWHMVSTGDVYVDLVTIEEVDCIAPEDEIEITHLEKDKATFTWVDAQNSSWETYVQEIGKGIPVGSGTIANSNSQSVTKTNGVGGKNLLPDTEYEFYVRASCGIGKTSYWVGPINFRTSCDVIGLPFWEGFNNTSTTVTCWTIVDGNKDFEGSNNGKVWSINTTKYEGDRGAEFFNSSFDVKNDDWLISPSFKVEASKYYRLRYHYRTMAYNKNDFEVLLSNNGIALSDFKKTLLEVKGHGNSNWEEEILMIGGYSGIINIGWHLSTENSRGYLYIDNVFLEEVDCPDPSFLNAENIEESAATLSWQDDFGKNWEYVLQKPGVGTPTVAGTPTKSKTNVVTKEFSGVNLESDTEYEYYVRTVCDNGKASDWAGPFVFRTICEVFTTPFWEGFNEGSESLICWTYIDQNDDSTSPTGGNIWRAYKTTNSFEGDQTLYFGGNNNDVKMLPHNDWAISPRISLDASKVYRLKYNYMTSNVVDLAEYELEVLASNSGLDIKGFNKSIIAKRKFEALNEWKEEFTYITGISGDVNFGWHVTSSAARTTFYVDNVFIEEVFNCPEPETLGVKDLESNSATITWTDNFDAKKWEYFVAKQGNGTPSGTGIKTSNKEVNIKVDNTGSNLVPNTDYEFYVRTECSDGTFSIWRGPYLFLTPCVTQKTPFWEGFNDLEKTYRCWSIIDGNSDYVPTSANNKWRVYSRAAGVFEGDQSMYFMGTAGKTHDDWLVSPMIEMETGMYVLKYNYKTNASSNNDFEVLYSTNGVDDKMFINNILASKIYKNGAFAEEVVFFNGVKGDVNLGWHVKSTGTTELYLDNITLKKVNTCPEPYYVKVVGETSNSIDIEWEQNDGVTEWEVLVVDYGKDENASPIKFITVTGNSKTTITGLNEGTSYTIFVRAKCLDGKSTSDWATSIDSGTANGDNNNCDGAIDLVVNEKTECEVVNPVSFVNATLSSIVEPSCGSTTKKRDIWFKFVAKEDVHMLRIENWKSLSGTTLSTISGALYETNCLSITANALYCFDFTSTNLNKVFKNLIPGNTYYLRLATTSASLKNIFDLCLTSPDYLKVNPSGDKYTIEELIEDVLVTSNCKLVSNISHQNGDGSAKAMSYNTVGYFNRGNTDFPFEEGIVLSTNEIQYVSGPALPSSKDFRGGNDERWVGDKDINDAIEAAGGGPLGATNKRVTQLEFDFIPIKDSIQFEYLFASNSYHVDCNSIGCGAGALFAAWLVDETTGEGQNLAKIKGTDVPIALNTITDSSKTGKRCQSSYPELYWKHYTSTQDDPLYAYVDFVGLTQAMESEKVYVVPGRKYHIKLAVIDFCTIVAHSSAVFFNAGSFNLGELNLGEDLLIETKTALCDGETATLKSGITVSSELKTEIEWFKDGVLIEGENGLDLTVGKTGEYEVRVKYVEIGCERSDSIVVELYPAISDTVNSPIPLNLCEKYINEWTFDLSSLETEMFKNTDRFIYETNYYKSKADADSDENRIPLEYVVELNPKSNQLFVRVENKDTGCFEVFDFFVTVKLSEAPIPNESVFVCAEYIFPDLKENQYYYTESKGNGIEYKSGDVLDIPGLYTIYVLQLNGDNGCYEEASYEVSITASVKADVFEDVELDCSIHILKPLSQYNRYFEKSGGEGEEYVVGQAIPSAQTIYVYASSEDGLCVDESSYTVSYVECPIQKGISPNGDGLNDSFDLSFHAVSDLKIFNRYGTEVYSYGRGYTNEWMGQDKNGNRLPDGTYYYVVVSHGNTRTGWVQINR